jgi:hypothetical protein
MEINDKGEFVPTPLPLLWFDHSQDDFSNAMGISRKREKTIKRAFEDFHEEDPKARFSKKLEAMMGFCENEQERIFFAVQLGIMKAGQHGEIKIGGDDMPAGLKEEILKAIRKKMEEDESEG